jgi:type I pantothenate kinase
VAVGKSTVARLLAELLPAEVGGAVVVVSLDGFLRTNAELEELGLTARKGAPETYDRAALRTLLRDVRAGTAAADVPVYAHRLQDRDPDRTIRVDAPAVLIVEGLGVLAGPAEGGVGDLVDLGVYVDAAEEDARAWYLERFRAWRAAAADDEGAYLHRIRGMPDEQADALAQRVWDETNAPNVRDNVLPTRAHADVVLEKGPDHRVERVLVRPG